GKELKGQDIQLISVSVDPVNDTPTQLAAWAQEFGPTSQWTLVTGTKQDIDGLLKAFSVFSADKANHSPLILLGNDRTGTWRRIHGLSPIQTIKAAFQSLVEERKGGSQTETAPDSPAHRYFTDVPLVNQDGETMRLYSDLLHGKVVVIHVFFASCRNTCPQM